LLGKIALSFLQQVGQIIPDGWFKYHLNMLNVENTHPGIRQDAGKWGLSSANDNKVFARAPVDLTLEQTSNADAASRLTGIAAFSQSVGARKR